MDNNNTNSPNEAQPEVAAAAEKPANKSKQIVIGLIFGAVFLWFAFRQVDLSEVGSVIGKISYGWMAPFVFVTILSHWFRGARWGLLIPKGIGKRLTDFRLFTAVMNMYAINYAFPRLGEVSRAVYINRKNNIPTSNLLGTVVLERVVDTFCLALILALSFFMVLSEPDIIRGLLGDSIASDLARFSLAEQWPWVLIMIFGAIGSLFGLFKLMEWFADKEIEHPWAKKGQNFLLSFWKGVISIQDVPHWGWFTFYTFGIWFCYLLMTYIPFYMLDLPDLYNLSLLDGMLIMAISSLGIIVPSPGGIGSYNYMVMLGMSVLYGIPEATGLAYSIVVYALNFLTIIVFAGISFLVDRQGWED